MAEANVDSAMNDEYADKADYVKGVGDLAEAAHRASNPGHRITNKQVENAPAEVGEAAAMYNSINNMFESVSAGKARQSAEDQADKYYEDNILTQPDKLSSRYSSDISTYDLNEDPDPMSNGEQWINAKTGKPIKVVDAYDRLTEDEQEEFDNALTTPKEGEYKIVN